MTHIDDGDPTVSKTLIDHFSTNKPNYILNVDIIGTGMADHCMIYGIRKEKRIEAQFLQKAETG